MAQLPDPIDTLDDFGKQLFQQMTALRGRIDGMYRTLLNHPHLVEKIADLGAFLRYHGALPGNIREFIILLTAHRKNAPYEWVKHLGPARQAGLPEEIIQAIHDGKPTFPEPYHPVATLTLQLLTNPSSIPSDLQESLLATYGTHGLIEMVILPGFYTMISGVLHAFDIPTPQDLK